MDTGPIGDDDCYPEGNERMVRPARVELATFWFVAKRSIQLSYGRPGVPRQSD
jgi:hypothetical protein